MSKIQSITDRLIKKMELSQTPVPGFIMGLSGTDSITAFEICYRALAHFGKEDRLMGVHYVTGQRHKPAWFERDIIPWMRERYPKAVAVAVEPLGGNQDQQRWADLHLRALNQLEHRDGVLSTHLLGEGKNFWTVGTINATEMYLGKYSILANSTSVQAIRSMWKTEVMLACGEIGVPEIAIETARIPDCFCGRDELAAQNIELIDLIIRHQVDPTQHDPELLKTLIDYVRTTKAENDFKLRTPFIP